MNPKNKWLAGSLSATLIAGACYWEGTRYTPYEDIVGRWTVCQGYAQPDVDKTHTYTKAECAMLLNKELLIHQQAVLKCVDVPINQHQLDAYTLFTYNVGGGAFCKSQVVKKLNRGDTKGSCDALLDWSYAGGKFVQGLRNRREYERKICLTPMQ